MSNLTEDKKFNVELIETPLKEISGTKGMVQTSTFVGSVNSIIKHINNVVSQTTQHLSTIKKEIGDKDSGLIEKIDKLRDEVDSFTDSDITNPNTFFSPELNPLG
ncbi:MULTISPECIES: hypothetical protein [unclassified Wolbachia]|uniref:hypothetical protein n=1 Tax=unclassified Wolbachia TaxID=2640676 RepID=UPI0007EEBBB2|nr:MULTISPECIES: hypothetical protein [unclassified Wolbachia]